MLLGFVNEAVVMVFKIYIYIYNIVPQLRALNKANVAFGRLEDLWTCES